MAQTAAAKVEPQAEVKIRKVIVDPKACVVQYAGQAFKVLFVRLPEGTTKDDINDPAIWVKVQNHPGTALRKHDSIYAVAFDETWAIEARVTSANMLAAVLAPSRVIVFQERSKAFFSDGTYAVDWDGRGYYVRRVKDGHPMTQPVSSEAVAERELRLLYPRPVG